MALNAYKTLFDPYLQKPFQPANFRMDMGGMLADIKMKYPRGVDVIAIVPAKTGSIRSSASTMPMWWTGCRR